MIPYGRQNINQDDIDSVLKVLKSDFLTQGPITPEFEAEISKYCKVKYAVAVTNATSALHLACLALGVGKDDIVWTSPISFVASANCAKYCGAKIDFIDIDNDTFNISIDLLKQKLIDAEKNNNIPKVIVVVHLAGHSCDMKELKDLSLKYNFKIIEDASHALGGKYLDLPVGSCSFSDITVFSFHPVKIITTCEGGVCTTNDKYLYEKIYTLRSHGIVRNQEDMKNISHGSWYYEQLELGYNYRLNDLQSALGINQLKRLDSFVKKRHEIAANYNLFFKNIDYVTTQKQKENIYSSYHLFIIRIKKNSKQTRKQIFEKFRSEGIFVNIHYIPIFKHPYYNNNFNESNYPNSLNYYSEAISIPIFPQLEEKDIVKVKEVFLKSSNFQNLF